MVIKFRDVGKVYRPARGGAPTTAVNRFNLVAPTGTTTVLVGSSGSGKTTLLRMVNAMVRPTSGAVLINDDDVASLDPIKLRRSIGYVPQEATLFPHRTVAQNVTEVLRITGSRRVDALAAAPALLERVGLPGNLAGRYPAELSGGQRGRVAVARALAADPAILLMDEPFAAVDPIVRLDLQNELLRLQRSMRKTILFITHDIKEAFRLGDQVVVLEPGGVVAQRGTPAEIQEAPASQFVADLISA